MACGRARGPSGSNPLDAPVARSACITKYPQNDHFT